MTDVQAPGARPEGAPRATFRVAGPLRLAVAFTLAAVAMVDSRDGCGRSLA